MTHVPTSDPEKLRKDVRKRSKELIKILATHRRLSIAGQVCTQLRSGYVTFNLLDMLLYYANDKEMMDATKRCRDALQKCMIARDIQT